MLTERQLFWTNVMELGLVALLLVYLIWMALSSLSARSTSGPTLADGLRQHAVEKAGAAFSSHVASHLPIIGGLTTVLGNVQDQVNDLRNMQSPIRQFFADAALTFYDKIEVYMIGLLYSLHRMRTIMQRSSATFNLMYHTLEHNVNSLVSMSNSPPFHMAQKLLSRTEWVARAGHRLCFTDKTTVQTSYNTKMSIMDSLPGTVMHDHTMVVAWYRFDKPIEECVYCYNKGVFVTGSHLIKWPPKDVQHHPQVIQLYDAQMREKMNRRRRRQTSSMMCCFPGISSSSSKKEAGNPLSGDVYMAFQDDDDDDDDGGYLLPRQDGHFSCPSRWITVNEAFRSEENKITGVLSRSCGQEESLYCVSTTSGKIVIQGTDFADFSECSPSSGDHALWYNEGMLSYLNECESAEVVRGLRPWDKKKHDLWMSNRTKQLAKSTKEPRRLTMNHPPELSMAEAKFTLDNFFKADTLVVMADGSYCAIRDIQEGDILKSAFPDKYSNALGHNKVIGTGRGHLGFFTMCKISLPTTSLVCTPYEKIFDPVVSRWRFAWDFPGATLLSKYHEDKLCNLTCTHGKFCVAQPAASAASPSSFLLVCDTYETVYTSVIDALRPEGMLV